jgi:prephenate dehydratase
VCQAIGQSSAFLDQHLPTAKRIPWPSTAGAAMSLLDEMLDTDVEGAGAAICSASAVADQPELEVLYEGTQAIKGESCSG